MQTVLACVANELHVGKYTRRAALGAILVGGGVYVSGTGAFDSVESDRSASVAVGDDSDGLVVLTGFNNSTVPDEPHSIEITNQTETTFTASSISADNSRFEFSTNTGSLPISDLSPTDSANVFVSTAAGTVGDVTDTLTLLFDGDPLSFSAERVLTVAADINTDVTAVPARPDSKAKHTWTVDNYTTGTNRQIDTITLDYSAIDYEKTAAFDRVNANKTTVRLTRELSGGPDRDTISVNQGNYSGKTATVDLSGAATTSVIDDPNDKPNLEVIVDNIENPNNTGDFTPEIDLNLDDNTTDTLSATLSIVNTPFFDVSITSSPSEIFEDDTFEIDYEVVNTGSQQDTQEIVLNANDTQEKSITEQLSTNGSKNSLTDTFSLDESKLSQSPPLSVVVESEDDSASRTINVLTPNEFSLTANPSAANTNSTHTWEASTTDFNGEVDTITVNYPSGFSLNGLTEEGIIVTMERQLSGGPDTSEIPVNSDDYSGPQATFDLSGSFNTDLIGLLKVEIDGITNAGAGQYHPTITVDGSNDTVQNTADLDVS